MSRIDTNMSDPLMASNHLTIVRWALASFVLLGHAWLLSTNYEPFKIFNWTGSFMAVNGFFILSGLLIAKSLHMRNDLKAYTMSRALRIYPALITVLLGFIFIFSPLFSATPGLHHIVDPDNWRYVLRVLLLGNPENAPGGIFPTSVEADFNGPLWTIRFELIAYILAGLAFFIGAIKSFKSSLLIFGAVQLSYWVVTLGGDNLQLPTAVEPLLRLSSAFLMGVVLWHWPAARRPHLWVVVSLCISFLLFGRTFLGEFTANLALTAILLRVGLPQKPIKSIVKIPDFSYGIYIWHFPIMQSVLYFNVGLAPHKLLAVSLPIILLVSGLSWYLIEKPALRLKSAILSLSPHLIKLKKTPVRENSIAPEEVRSPLPDQVGGI